VERPAPSKQRLFVALSLPDDARAAMVEWQHDAFGGFSRSVRLVRPDALHVTLAFLGYLSEDPVGVVAEAAFRGVPRDQPLFEPLAVKPVPPRRTRLWALDLADIGGHATAIQAAVSANLASAGLYEPEKRPFWTHVTVARLRARARAPKIDVPPPAVRRFGAESVVLYRSHLSRDGARYEPLSTLPLGRAAAG